jgi:prepilin-type N-terminal cleavage/methylation domain-containing protein
MIRKGVTLIELIVVLALIGIVLPLTYGIYLNGIKLSNYISNNIDVQTEGSFAINQINQDLRLANYTSDRFITDGDGIRQVKYLNINFNDTIKDVNPIYYVKSLTSSDSFVYVTTPAPDPDDKANGYSDVYKFFLTLVHNTTDSAKGRTISISKVITGKNKLLNNGNVTTDFSIPTSLTYINDFENIAFNIAPIYKGRNEIMIDPNPLIDENYIVLGCFKYNGNKDYVYYMDHSGIKYYAQLGAMDKIAGDYYILDYKKLIIHNVKNFDISHTGITFNIHFDKKTSNNNDYPFDVDVNPIYLGGGD